MNGHAILDLARALAKVAHDGQSRKGAGEPYILHPERVAEAVKGWELKAIAWLHDVLEDTTVDLATLENLFPQRIVLAVRMLSNNDPLWENTTYMERIGRLHDLAIKPQTGDDKYVREAAALAAQVKIADIKDNLHDLPELPGDWQKMEKRYRRALAVLEADDEA